MAQILSPGGVKPTQWRLDPALVEPRYKRLAQATIITPWDGAIPRELRYKGAATVTGTPVVRAGRHGYAIDYDDNADRLRYDSTPEMLTVTEFTMAIVARPADASSSSGARGIHWGTENNHPAGALIYYPSTGNNTTNGWEFRAQSADGTSGVDRDQAIAPSGSSPADEWALVLGRKRQSGAVELWQNGSLIAEVPGADPGVGNIDTTFYIGDRAGGDRPFRGLVDTLFVWSWGLSDGELQAWFADPFGPFRPARRRRVFVAAGGGTVPVGLATETDTAFGVGAAKDATVGLASEADTGLSVGAAKARTAGLASETDAAFGLTVAKALAVALTTETDSALPVTASGAVDVGLASEADSALGIGALKTVAVGLSTETVTALTVTPLTGTPVGLATETDTALAVSIAKALAAGLSTEADAALGATPVRTIVLGQANETDTALALTALKSVTTGLAVETDQGLVVVASKSQSVGLATETDTALGVLVIGAAVELTGPFKAQFTDPVRVAVWIDPVRVAQFTDPARKGEWQES